MFALHTFAHSHFLSFHRSLSCITVVIKLVCISTTYFYILVYKIIYRRLWFQLFCNKGQASTPRRLKWFRNYLWEAPDAAHLRHVLKLNIFWRCLLKADVFLSTEITFSERRSAKVLASTSVRVPCTSFPFEDRSTDDIQCGELKMLKRQYIWIILRNLFINNHILSRYTRIHIIYRFRMAFLSSYSENNMRHPAGENPPITRNRLPRNRFGIYVCHSASRERNS